MPFQGAPTAPSHANPGPRSAEFPFENTYARLPARFYARLNPTRVAAPRLVKLNTDLAVKLGLNPEALTSQNGVEILAGNRVPEGAEPLAMAYAGHQFGYFVPQLGDGRAILLGEVRGQDGRRYDIQLKGPGRTPFSRGGDGRAALGPVVREYIVSEAMTALGVPSTRALAAVSTGEHVVREAPLPGAVLTRVAASHLRVGTFQYFAARGDVEGLQTLADYALARHYPEAAGAEHPRRALLDGVIARQARLVTHWMLLGFVHGVMNTDNMSISGETIDFGPCAFMEAYNPETVFSSIDRNGRYAYGNQPHAAQWNLARLAEAMLPLLLQETGSEEGALESANEALAAFLPQFEAAYNAGLSRKIGLTTAREDDPLLADDLLECMAANGADFTLTFRRLCAATADPEGDAAVRALFADPASYDVWAARWRSRCAEDPVPGEQRGAAMRLVNPLFIPRNHLVQRAIDAATVDGNFEPFEQMLDVVSRPYDDRPGLESYTIPARPEERITQTFCGT